MASNPSYQVLSSEGNVHKVLLKTNDVALANMVRRAILTEVETYAIDVVVFDENTSARHDELLALRMGQCVIDYEQFKGLDESVRDGLRSHIDVSGPGVFSTDNIPGIPFRYTTPIATLRAGQRIVCDVIVKKNIGRTHPKWSPASTVALKDDVRGYILTIKDIDMMSIENIMKFGIAKIQDAADRKPIDIFSKQLQPKAAAGPAGQPNVSALTNPPMSVKTLQFSRGNFTLLDDGELIGGTKQRVLGDVLPRVAQKEIVYAGPEGGMAQVALAYVAGLTGKKATVFVQAGHSAHPPLSQLAARYGADIHYDAGNGRSLKDTEAAAALYVANRPGAVLMPFGLFGKDQDPYGLVESFERVLRIALRDVAPPKRLWLVAGSGFILKMLQNIYPSCSFMVVQVGKKIWPDQIRDNDRLFVSPYKFNESVANAELPPYPSIPWYDAKLWKFFQEQGRSGDYIWNVARLPTQPRAQGQVGEAVMSIDKLFDVIAVLNALRSGTISELVRTLTAQLASYNIPDASRKIQKFITDCYIKWIFDANISGKLNNFVPTEVIVLADDIDYLTRVVLQRPDVKLNNYITPQLSTLLAQANRDVAAIMASPTQTKVSVKVEPNKIIVSNNKGLPVINFGISSVQDRLLRSRYTGSNFDVDVAKLVLMYNYLNTPNELLSLPPPVLTQYKVDHEGFGSPLNTTLRSFSSAWKSLEAPFGSSGNFFDLVFASGKTYTISPPADLQLMNRAIDKMLRALQTTPGLIFIVDVPVWDPETQRKYGFKVYDTEFKGVSDILKSPYLKSRFVMNTDYKFYDYFTDKYVPVVPTHVFVVSNVTPSYTAEQIAQTWLASSK
jgi:hypothetical protein